MLRKFNPRALVAVLRAYSPILFALSFSAVTAHAQAAGGGGGNFDATNISNFTTTLVNAVHTVGAGFVLIGLFFAAFQFLGRNITQGLVGLFGVLIGAGIFTWGPAWVTSLTGTTVGQ